MNLHEYQGKAILKSYGVAVQEGIVVDRVEDALAAANELTAAAAVAAVAEAEAEAASHENISNSRSKT